MLMKETLRKNNPNFAKDVPALYVNLIIILITFSDKNRGIIFVPTFLIILPFDASLL